MKWIAMRLLRGAEGVTLTELLVVVSVVGILASISLPALTTTLDEATVLKVRTDLKTIDDAIVAYSIIEGKYPGALSLEELTAKGYFRSEPRPPFKIAGYASSLKRYEIDASLNRAFLQLERDRTNVRFFSDSMLPGE